MTNLRSCSAALCLLLAAACGPQVELESTSGGSSDSSAGFNTMLPTTAQSGTTDNPPPPPPSSTTDGPLDTGETTDSPWLDFPEFCSTIEQNCPPGYKCMPYANDGGSAWNDTMCVEIVDNPNGPGEPCTVVGSGVSGLDDCDGTSMCWDIDVDTNEGSCVPFCIGTLVEPGCADTCASCTISGEGVLNLCLSGWDPLEQDCEPDQACYPVGDGFVCGPYAGEPDATVGSPCEFLNVCPAGTACISAAAVPGCEGSAGCCSPYCEVGADESCNVELPGSLCMSWFENKEDGPPKECTSGQVGVCAVP